jgi:cytidine deaminase
VVLKKYAMINGEISPTALIEDAWAVRGHARVLGKTRVGAAVLSSTGRVFVGCNVEHKFRSHDVHAEVNALTSMIAGGDTLAVAIAIASERDRFTPCGGCMDWIFELGGPRCVVYVASSGRAVTAQHFAEELMPFYPY